MKICIFSFIIIAGSYANIPNEKLLESWKLFKETYQISYTKSNELQRLQIFRKNLETINEHNKLYDSGQVSYKMGITQFSDMTQEEFIKYLTRFEYRIEQSDNIHEFNPPEDFVIPEFVDWREKGAVSKIKDQGRCGSCWAFSAVGSLESQNFISNKELILLSEQQLVDCAREDYGNYGCAGGLMDSAFEYVINNGIVSEDSYPYKGKDGICANISNSVVQATSIVQIESKNEADLQVAIALKGPLSVAVDASPWMFYNEGILDVEYCGSNLFELNHGVLAVGFGVKDGKEYYLIKNSWGTFWGEDGYVKLARNRDNMCGIATQSSYPVVEKIAN